MADRRRALPWLDSDAPFAKHVCEFAGLACTVGVGQTWRLAGREIDVNVELDTRGIYVIYLLKGWPMMVGRRGKTARVLLLAELYAFALTSANTGKVPARMFEGPELSRLKAKAAIESGRVERPHVPLPVLPDGALPPAKTMLNLIGDVVAWRTLTGEDPWPTPLVAPWLASVTGVDEKVIRNGKDWLARHGVIVCVGEAPSRHHNRPMNLWELAG